MLWLFFSFKGRTGRGNWLFATFALYLLSSVVFYGLKLLGDRFENEATNVTQLLLLAGVFVVVILAVWTNSALMVKRLHDLNMTGKLITLYWIPTLLVLLFSFIEPNPDFERIGFLTIHTVLQAVTVFVGLFAFFWFGFGRGTAGDNKYGSRQFSY